MSKSLDRSYGQSEYLLKRDDEGNHIISIRTATMSIALFLNKDEYRQFQEDCKEVFDD